MQLETTSKYGQPTPQETYSMGELYNTRALLNEVSTALWGGPLHR